MGCFHAKHHSSDLHPNVYRVVNLDSNRVETCTGQLEITDTDIILYREGRDSTVWPLHSLRRYGFDNDIFSFESGRRCETGEGIYAFRCRRASSLFGKLQQQILSLNVVHDSVPYPVSRLSSPPNGRQALQASVIHRSSIDNGLPNMLVQGNNNLININPQIDENQSPRSPSSADILEVMPLYPRNQNTSSHASNVYQVRDFKREHNNNRTELNTETPHVYTNDFNRDLAMLRSTLRGTDFAMSEIEDTLFLESRYMNERVTSNPANGLSPTLSTSSEHYAQLSMEQQEPAPLYVNVNSEMNDAIKNNTVPNTPLTPKQIDYASLAVKKPDMNSYANLTLGDPENLIKKSVSTPKEKKQNCSETDTVLMSPIDELEVNYAILDMGFKRKGKKHSKELILPENQSLVSKNESTASVSTLSRSGRLMSQSSVDKGAPPPPGGYTTIDFEKTVALTSVATATEDDCQRKIRHNSGNLHLGSPTSNDKNK